MAESGLPFESSAPVCETHGWSLVELTQSTFCLGEQANATNKQTAIARYFVIIIICINKRFTHFGDKFVLVSCFRGFTPTVIDILPLRGIGNTPSEIRSLALKELHLNNRGCKPSGNGTLPGAPAPKGMNLFSPFGDGFVLVFLSVGLHPRLLIFYHFVALATPHQRSGPKL